MKINYTNIALLLKILLILIILINPILQVITLKSTMSILEIAKMETEDVVEPYTSTTPMLSRDALYYLYECGGKIGIYDAKSSILLDVVDVFASSLPAKDRKLLKSGIAIYSFSDLSKIIDDFSS